MTRMHLPDLPRLMVDEAVKAALLEDWGRAGDITSQATLPATAQATAVIAARKPGVLAGLALAHVREAFPIEQILFPERRIEPELLARSCDIVFVGLGTHHHAHGIAGQLALHHEGEAAHTEHDDHRPNEALLDVRERVHGAASAASHTS